MKCQTLTSCTWASPTATDTIQTSLLTLENSDFKNKEREELKWIFNKLIQGDTWNDIWVCLIYPHWLIFILKLLALDKIGFNMISCLWYCTWLLHNNCENLKKENSHLCHFSWVLFVIKSFRYISWSFITSMHSFSKWSVSRISCLTTVFIVNTNTGKCIFH